MLTTALKMPLVMLLTAGLVSLLNQGAGLARVDLAAQADSFIHVEGQADYKVKAELGDDPARTGVYTFSFKLNAFRAACEKMGAEKVPHGDAGYRFHLIGGYHMQIQVWAGDDEFPPNAQILYSDNFADGFAAEDRVVAGDILISTVRTYM